MLWIDGHNPLSLKNLGLRPQLRQSFAAPAEGLPGQCPGRTARERIKDYSPCLPCAAYLDRGLSMCS